MMAARTSSSTVLHQIRWFQEPWRRRGGRVRHRICWVLHQGHRCGQSEHMARDCSGGGISCSGGGRYSRGGGSYGGSKEEGYGGGGGGGNCYNCGGSGYFVLFFFLFPGFRK
ncbi:hypothetical protein Dsin_018453 [Dipteronia sinensis]|uniref:CCHC-type domain-containing protein n=1 Tax=Dipteronia sinensis TaxID=43782 RepID=A0AAE0A5C0_9ROSI|nr:hypothetical protein Dsin_018453 [Dipteronia sinensis]